jgi:hypothetical protein
MMRECRAVCRFLETELKRNHHPGRVVLLHCGVPVKVQNFQCIFGFTKQTKKNNQIKAKETHLSQLKKNLNLLNK